MATCHACNTSFDDVYNFCPNCGKAKGVAYLSNAKMLDEVFGDKNAAFCALGSDFVPEFRKYLGRLLKSDEEIYAYWWDITLKKLYIFSSLRVMRLYVGRRNKNFFGKITAVGFTGEEWSNGMLSSSWFDPRSWIQAAVFTITPHVQAARGGIRIEDWDKKNLKLVADMVKERIG